MKSCQLKWKATYPQSIVCKIPYIHRVPVDLNSRRWSGFIEILCFSSQVCVALEGIESTWLLTVFDRYTVKC